MSDPLSLLREQFINKKPVSHDATHIFIGDLKFSRNVLTAYKQDRGACLTPDARERHAAPPQRAALPRGRAPLSLQIQDRQHRRECSLPMRACVQAPSGGRTRALGGAGAARSWPAAGGACWRGGGRATAASAPALIPAGPRLHSFVTLTCFFPRPPVPPCACAVVGAIHREQAVATRIRSRRYTICCRSRTLLVRPRCVPIMKSARCVSLQAHDSMCARQVRGRAGSGTAVVGAAGADGWDKSSRRYAA